MNVCEAHSWCCFTLLLIHAEGSMLLLRRNLVKEKEGAWRRCIYRKYASCRWLKDAGRKFTRADIVLSISRGPPGQWFPEIEYWASTIFVGTSGIPPKIIYRSVKSYSTTPGQSRPGINGNKSLICIRQSSSITGALPSDCLVSYPGHLLEESYPYAVGVFNSPRRLGHKISECVISFSLPANTYTIKELLRKAVSDTEIISK